jgi:hypothetical protein
LLPLNLYARVRFAISFARETAGAARTRLSLRPLSFGANDFAKLGRIVPREREVMVVARMSQRVARMRAR